MPVHDPVAITEERKQLVEEHVDGCIPVLSNGLMQGVADEPDDHRLDDLSDQIVVSSQ